MRLTRMTTRRWMVAVAVVALMIGGGVWLKQRRDYFLLLAQSHQNEVTSSTARVEALKRRGRDTSGMSKEEIVHLYRNYERMKDRADHHAAMAEKYRHAARYPWLFVEPDPPEPDLGIPAEPDPPEPGRERRREGSGPIQYHA